MPLLLKQDRPRGTGRQVPGRRRLEDAANRSVERLRVRLARALRRLQTRAERLEVGRALERGDLPTLLSALDLTLGSSSVELLRDNLEEVRAELREVLRRGALAAAPDLPRDVGIGISLDLTNPRAVQFVRRYEFDLVVGIQTRQVRGLRRALTRALGGEFGPFDLARERIKPLIGLTENQAAWTLNYRQQLVERTTGGLTPVDARRVSAKDAALGRRHLSGEVTLTPAQIDRLVARYADSLLNLRAQNIARTEAIRATVAGQKLLWEQAAMEGLVVRERVRRFAIFTRDERTRRTHRRIPELNPEGVPLGGQYRTDFGPRDGPPFEPNCRCTEVVREVEEELL